MAHAAVRPWPAGRTPASGKQVTAVVCAAFDAATDDALLAVRDRVIALGVRLPARPPHRPHLTLAAARVPGAAVSEVVDVTAAVAVAHSPVRLSLTEVGRFGRAGALWLGPAEPGDLRALQRAADDAITTAGWGRAFGRRSSPHEWVPHCTLATRLHPARLRDVQARLAADYRAIEGTVAGLAVILVGGSGDVGLVPLGAPG